MSINFNNISMDQIRVEVFKRTGVSIDADDPFFVAIKLLLFAAQTIEEQVAETTDGLKKVTADANSAISRIPRSTRSSDSVKPTAVIERETPETPEMRGWRLAREKQIEDEKKAAAALAAKYVSERLAAEIPKYVFWTETDREAAQQLDDISQQLYKKVRRLVVGAAAAICICTLAAGWIFTK